MATKRVRSYHHGDLRAALIAASTDLIKKKGVAGFSLREAARVVGVDASACYRHFRDRQAVLIAIAQTGFARLATIFARERTKQQAAEVDDKIVGLLLAYFDFATKHPAEFRVMFGESGLHSRDPRLRPRDTARTAAEQLEDLAAEYAKKERISSIGAVELANALWAIAHGTARLVIDGAATLDEREAHALIDGAAVALLNGAL